MGDEQITRMRGIGRFFGHVFGAVKSPAGGPRRVEVRRETEQEQRAGVVLRRTTVEEIELPEGWSKEDGR